jgi:hypothetical protein
MLTLGSLVLHHEFSVGVVLGVCIVPSPNQKLHCGLPESSSILAMRYGGPGDSARNERNHRKSDPAYEISNNWCNGLSFESLVKAVSSRLFSRVESLRNATKSERNACMTVSLCKIKSESCSCDFKQDSATNFRSRTPTTQIFLNPPVRNPRKAPETNPEPPGWIIGGPKTF